jgi:hypothetical protein
MGGDIESVFLAVAASAQGYMHSLIENGTHSDGESGYLFRGKREVRVFAGAESWEEVAKTRFHLFDAVTTPWILNLDDDDGVLGALDLAAIPQACGMIHTDVLGVITTAPPSDCPDLKSLPGDAYVRPSKCIKVRSDAHMFRGSFYGYRKEAWQSVSGVIDRHETDYEEWRVVWHMLHNGWEDYHVPEVKQFQRINDLGQGRRRRADGLPLWKDVCANLELTFNK